MKNFPLISFFVLMILLNANSSAQISSYIFGIHNPSSGTFYFARMDTATGLITDLGQVPINGIGAASSCVNVSTSEYYFCPGKSIMTFDALTGNMVSDDTLPIPATAHFLQVAFNPCDSNFYGIVNDPPNSISFSRYNPVSGIMTTLTTLKPNMGFALGSYGVLDPVTGIYSFNNGHIIGLDIVTGQIIYDTDINGVFGHIALKCSTHEIFGTYFLSGEQIKMLATINPYTGNVTPVSGTGWTQGLMKPALGGDFINQGTGDYYYVGANVILGISTVTGDVVYDKQGVNGILLIQHFSDCNCASVGLEENDLAELITISPNPASSTFTVHTFRPIENMDLEVYNMLGGKVDNRQYTIDKKEITIDVSDLHPGLYFVKLQSEKGTSIQKLIIQ